MLDESEEQTEAKKNQSDLMLKRYEDNPLLIIEAKDRFEKSKQKNPEKFYGNANKNGKLSESVSSKLSPLSHTPIKGGNKSLLSENLHTSEFDKYNITNKSILEMSEKSDKTKSFNKSYKMTDLLSSNTSTYKVTDS